MKSMPKINGKIALCSFLLAATPVFLNAQNDGDISNIEDLVLTLQNIVNLLIPIAASVALLAFFFGLAKYIFQAGSEDAKDQGKRIMVGGVIALFLIAAVGGIIEFIAAALDINTGGSIPVPSVGPGASNG